jgi:hypothetical protein
MSDSNVYTAERILAKRKYRGVTQYYIKWKGYSIKDSTWEPAENIFDPGLIEAFETGRSYRSSASLAAILNSSGASTNSSSQKSQSSTSSTRSTSSKRGRGRPRKSYSQQRQEQARLQQHIERQQNKTQPSTTTTTSSTTTTTTTTTNRASAASSAAAATTTTNATTKTSQKAKTTADVSGQVTQSQSWGLIVFNPQDRQAATEEIVYEPELTKEPILVTDVTSDDQTVTISECKTPEGFFRT